MLAAFGTHHHRRLVHALMACVALLLLVSGIAIGLVIRQLVAGAAPGDIEACVNRYTGGFRMGPKGVTTCNANESKVVWPATQPTVIPPPQYTQRTVVVGVGAGTSGTQSIPCNFEGSEYIATGGGFRRADPALAINGSYPKRRTAHGLGCRLYQHGGAVDRPLRVRDLHDAAAGAIGWPNHGRRAAGTGRSTPIGSDGLPRRYLLKSTYSGADEPSSLRPGMSKILDARPGLERLSSTQSRDEA